MHSNHEAIDVQSNKSTKIIVSQAIKQGTVVKTEMVLQHTKFVYARIMTATKEPSDSIAIIQHSSSAGMGSGESAASSIGKVSAT
jgi:hypothetical protein